MTGRDIKKARTGAGVSQAALAKALKVNQTALSRMEGGDRPIPEDFPPKVKDALIRITTERTQKVLAATSAA